MKKFTEEFPNAKLLAYGLIVCWGNLIYGSEIVSDRVLDAFDLSSVFIVSTSALALIYVLFVLFFNRFRNLSYRSVAVAGGIIMSVASILLTFTLGALVWPLAALTVFAALTGIGSAMMYFCCAHPYAETPPRKSALFSLFSLFIMVSVYFLISGAPEVVSKAAFCVLPICAAFLLPITERERIAPRDEGKGEALPSAAWRFALSIALISLILNVGVGYLSSSTDYPALYSSASMGHLIALALGIVMFIYVFRSEESFDYCQIFYPVVLLAVVLLAFSYEFGPNSAFAVSLATGIRDISTLVIWCMLVYIMYHQKNVASLKIFAIGQACATFGSVIGSLAGTYYAVSGFTQQGEATAFYLVLIVALVAVVTLVFPERVLKKLIVLNPSDLKILGSKEGGRSRPWREKCIAYAVDYGLTPREQEVFLLVARGKTNEFIAEELIISSLTVKTHRQNTYAKMHVHSAQELIDAIEKYD